jgi:hypothetical protein
MEEEREKKIMEAELILGGLFFLGIDLFAGLLDFLGVGIIIGGILQAGGTFAATVFFWLKGDKGALKFGRQIVKYAANFLPWVPTLFLAFIIESYLFNHPGKLGALEKIKGAPTGGKKG